MGIIGTILHNLKNMKRAKAIRRMPRAELMAMDDNDFYEAMEIVCEDAVYDLKEQQDLLGALIFAYTLIKLEAEVNNGGLCQFFVNSSRDCAPYVSEALAAVGAMETKSHFDRFVAENGIDVQELSSFRISRLEEFEAQTKRFDFDAFDDRFYEDNTLHQRIVDYLRSNVEQILK